MTTPDLDLRQTVMGRVLLLLEPFRDSDGLTLTELAERTGFPRSSTHRMLLQLIEVGWLRRTGTTYHLGPKMAELGSLAQVHDRIHQAAQSDMYSLHKRTGMAVHLTVLDGDDVLYLDKAGGRWAAVHLDTRAGLRVPADTTVDGHALTTFRDTRRPTTHEQAFDHDSGQRLYSLTAAFDAGDGEIAALSLVGRSPTPAGLADELRSVADRIEDALTS